MILPTQIGTESFISLNSLITFMVNSLNASEVSTTIISAPASMQALARSFHPLCVEIAAPTAMFSTSFLNAIFTNLPNSSKTTK